MFTWLLWEQNIKNPVVLNRNDAKGSPGIWTEKEIFGYWDIRVAVSGKYTVKARFISEIDDPGTLYLRLYPFLYASTSTQKTDSLSIKNIHLDANNYRLEFFFNGFKNLTILPFPRVLSKYTILSLKITKHTINQWV